MGIGLFTEVDRAALAMYCQAYGRWVHAERKCAELEDGIVATTDKGYSHLHAWRLEANKAMEQVKGILPEFGLTPSARSRLHVPQEPSEPSLAEQLFALVGSAAEDGDGD
jgi:P27 family predicted phage terminase small subunit